MKELKKYEFQGKMLTAQEIADILGAKKSTIYTRVSNHIPLEKNVRTRNKLHEYNGKEYTWSQLAKIAGCPVTTLKSRVQKGLTIEQAVKRGEKNKRFQKKERIGEAILKAWDGGNRTIEEVVEITGCTKKQINAYIDVEYAEKLEVFKKYGY